ncbi:MAG: ABC-type transport auxiliary lipoprotein family protein [Litorimonas sp.]
MKHSVGLLRGAYFMSFWKNTAVIATAVSLASCVSILPDPAPADTVYRLLTPEKSIPSAPDAVVVRIDRPGGLNVFETRDILVTPNGRSLSSLSKAKWVELTPLMLQESLLDHMTHTANLIGVLPSSNSRSDTRLYLTVKNFEAQFDNGDDNAPIAVVKYTVTLVNAADRKLIDSYTTQQTLRANEPRVSSIVMALEGANNAAMGDIIAWVETQNLPRGR